MRSWKGADVETECHSDKSVQVNTIIRSCGRCAGSLSPMITMRKHSNLTSASSSIAGNNSSCDDDDDDSTPLSGDGEVASIFFGEQQPRTVSDRKKRRCTGIRMLRRRRRLFDFFMQPSSAHEFGLINPWKRTADSNSSLSITLNVGATCRRPCEQLARDDERLRDFRAHARCAIEAVDSSMGKK